jgi:nuclear-control-of-ATPase protein 2
MVFRSPFELTRQECYSYRQVLEKIRDDRAERLGRLAASRPNSLLDVGDLTRFIGTLDRIIDDSGSAETPAHGNSLLATLSVINDTGILQSSYMYEVGISSLRRPSRLTRMWPRLLIIPPVTLIIFRLVYGSEKSLAEHAIQIMETAAGFWRNYLVHPFKDILDTVRTGGEEGARIVSPEGLKADMEARGAFLSIRPLLIHLCSHWSGWFWRLAKRIITLPLLNLNTCQCKYDRGI